MTVVHHTTKFGPTLDPRYGSSEIDCRGAGLRAYTRSLATVIAVSGNIDASNAGVVRETASRFLYVDKAVILDLSNTNSFGVQGLQFLFAFDDECAEAGVEWALVAGPAVSVTLAAADHNDTYPLVSSVDQALQRFSHPERRCALHELVTNTTRAAVKPPSPADN
jgi:anti-anti-sigma regulatory factor